MKKFLTFILVLFLSLFIAEGALAAINNVRLICYNLTHYKYDIDCNIYASGYYEVIQDLRKAECNLDKEYQYIQSANYIEIGPGEPMAKYASGGMPNNYDYNHFVRYDFKKGAKFDLKYRINERIWT